MVTHLIVGDDNWEPTGADLQEILHRFQKTPFTYADHVPGVQINKVEGSILAVEVDPALNLSQEEIANLIDMFQHAWFDPNGGVVVTRRGIEFLTEAEA